MPPAVLMLEVVRYGTDWPTWIEASLLSKAVICGRLKTSSLPCVFKARIKTLKASDPPLKTKPPGPPEEEARPTPKFEIPWGANTPGETKGLFPKGSVVL